MSTETGTLITYLRWIVGFLGIFLILLMIAGPTLFAQGRAPVTYAAPFAAPFAVPFAEVTLVPGTTLVVIRDPRGADQMIVSTFYWQKIPNIEKPIMRSVTSVVPVAKDVAIAADGAPDPKSVETVHVSLIKITDRMEWKNTPPTSK